MSALDPSRRRFLAVTGLSATLLIAAGALAGRRKASAAPLLGESADATRIVRALVPSMLAGALPVEPRDSATSGTAPRSAVDEVVRDALAGMDGLPPHARRELAQLFALLGFAPSRILVAGLRRPWEDATPTEIDAVLAGWRESRLELRRAAYDALHALIMGAWYGNARAWARIGYPGPPSVA